MQQPSRPIRPSGNDPCKALRMPNPPILSIIIPVYNEAALIERLLRRLAAANTAPYRAEIIAVDDGSTDATAALLAAATGSYDNLRVISLGENRGKTAALRAGFAAARGEVVIVQDADLEYAPEDYPLLLQPFSDPAVTVVYGSRFLRNRWPDGMRLENWLANRLFTLLANRLFHAGITDEGTAYKAFRRVLLGTVTLEATGFSFCAEVTCKLADRNIPIREVPIAYSARSKTEGKKPRFRDGIGIVATILRLKARQLSGKPL